MTVTLLNALINNGIWEKSGVHKKDTHEGFVVALNFIYSEIKENKL